MVRRILIVALACAGCMASIAHAQISPEEAMKRLHEKQAARDAAREKIVQIKQGDLDDLKSELAKLKAQVESLQNELAAAKASTVASAQPAVVKTPLSIAVGITKEEVMRFIQVHHEEYELMADLPTEMKITQKAKHKVFDGGIGTNGVSNFARYSEKLRPDQVLTLEMIGGKVASISQMKVPTQTDEIQPYVPPHRR